MAAFQPNYKNFMNGGGLKVPKSLISRGNNGTTMSVF